MAGTDREKALDAALAQIERQFGKGAVMRMGERPNEPIEVIPTGSTALDVALGVGGLPRGRVVEVYGPESSGKTTLTLHAVANAQKAGGQVAFVDAEHALDPEYAKKLGVDIDNLILSQPDNGEQALEIVDMLVRSGALDLIVIDSVAALVPRAEIGSCRLRLLTGTPRTRSQLADWRCASGRSRTRPRKRCCPGSRRSA
ncbi:Protein RecA [Streptomyces tendae]